MAGVERFYAPPTLLKAYSGTTMDGAFAAGVYYTHATVTITAGTWVVFAGVSVINLSTTDDASVGIYDTTNAVQVPNSRGAAATTTTSVRAGITSQQTLMTVTANTQLHPLTFPNGGSTLRIAAAAYGAAGYVSALRLSVP